MVQFAMENSNPLMPDLNSPTFTAAIDLLENKMVKMVQANKYFFLHQCLLGVFCKQIIFYSSFENIQISYIHKQSKESLVPEDWCRGMVS